MREIPFGRPIIGEEEKRAALEVLSGHILVHGPRAHDFENDFAQFVGAPAATSAASCTAALHLSYFHYGLKAGDEVIAPAQTHVATAHAIEYCGGKPVFIDAEPATGNIDIDQIESAITSCTRAITVVHYLGVPVEMDRINLIAKKHNLYVIEDCALALGTYYRGVHAGLLGDTGSFSFYPVKHITTAEGGMLISKHQDVVAAISKKKAFGVDRTHTERAIPGVYDVTMLGFNYRMNEISAAIGIEQMKRVPWILKKRQENFDALAQALTDVDEVTILRSTDPAFQSSHYCLSVVLGEKLMSKRFEIAGSLKEKGIGTSVYYPKPVPHMKYYREKYGFDLDTYPIASRISYGSIALPVGPHLEVEDMLYIADSFRASIARYS